MTGLTGVVPVMAARFAIGRGTSQGAPTMPQIAPCRVNVPVVAVVVPELQRMFVPESAPVPPVRVVLVFTSMEPTAPSRFVPMTFSVPPVRLTAPPVMSNETELPAANGFTKQLFAPQGTVPNELTE